MALGRNWARDRYWGTVEPGISGEVGGGLWQGLLAQAYGMDLEKQQGLKITRDRDVEASGQYEVYKKRGITDQQLGGYDNTRSDNTIDDLNSRYNAYLKKEEKSKDAKSLQQLKDVHNITNTSNEKMQTERLLVDKLNRAEDRAARLEELEASDLRAQQQWARQMEYEDKKTAASKEEKALEALVAGLASIGAGFA
jgi:hypothetical protein